jgi:hypothetical protein
MKVNRKIIRVLLFAFLLYSIAFGTRSIPVLAQNPPGWSAQQRIPGYNNDTNPPVLIADQNRTVHAFTSQQVGDNGKEIAVVYSQWTPEQGWTDPVDILLSPIKNEARLLSVFLDKTGLFHVIFFGGDNIEANIYYSQAPAIKAGQVSAWSKPELVGESALNPEDGVIIGDDNGYLVIVYSGTRNGNGLYAIYSTDGGNTWSNPESIFMTNDDILYPFDSQVYYEQLGQVYIVWSVYNSAGNGASVYYSKYDIGQGKWTDPFQLATGVGLGVGLPDVIKIQGDVIVTYYDSSANAQWMVQSSDEGQTWTEPVRIAPLHIGRNGAVSLALDSKNVLHLLFGERIPGTGGPDIHGMWHVLWENGRFSEAEAVVSGPLVTDSQGDKSFDPYAASAVIVQGNILLDTWRTDPGPQSKSNGVWYSFTTLDAPELPISTLAAPQSTQSVPPTPTLERFISTPTPTIKFLQEGSTGDSSPGNAASLNQPALSLGTGLIPATLFITIIVIISFARRQNHERGRKSKEIE